MRPGCSRSPRLVPLGGPRPQVTRPVPSTWMLLVAAVLVGVAAGSWRQPAGVHTQRPRLVRLRLLVAGAVGQALVWVLPHGPAALLLALSLALLLAFAIANRNITGIAVIGVGLAANLASVLLNGGMPVRPEALVAAGVASRKRSQRWSSAQAVTSRAPLTECRFWEMCCPLERWTRSRRLAISSCSQGLVDADRCARTPTASAVGRGPPRGLRCGALCSYLDSSQGRPGLRCRTQPDTRVRVPVLRPARRERSRSQRRGERRSLF